MAVHSQVVAAGPSRRLAQQDSPAPSEKPKRLAYFINCFPNLIETMIYREVGALRALGNEVCIFSIRRPAPAEIPAEAQSFCANTFYILPLGLFQLLKTHMRALLRSPVRYWQILFTVLSGTHMHFRDRLRTLCHFTEAVAVLPAVEALQVDHLHAHWAVGAATTAMVVSRFLGIPFTFTAHAYDIWREKLLLPEKLRAAQAIVTCTDYNRQHLAQTYGVSMEKLHVVYHGVDIGRFPPGEPPHNPEPVLLSVGRLVEQKGFDRLLRACAALTQQGYRFRCDIIGDGPLRRDLEQLTDELGLCERVRFHGRMFQEQLIEYYATADLFVLPCIEASDGDRDGIPNVLIEAMAMQLPIISTRFSGVPELVIDGVTGVLVESNDVPALVEAMRGLLDDPARRSSLGQAGRQRVLEDFTIERSATMLHQLFASLIATRTNRTQSFPPRQTGAATSRAHACVRAWDTHASTHEH